MSRREGGTGVWTGQRLRTVFAVVVGVSVTALGLTIPIPAEAAALASSASLASGAPLACSSAQEVGQPSRTLTGRVVDAASGAPIASARLRLFRAPADAQLRLFPAPAGDGEGYRGGAGDVDPATLGQATSESTTDANGVYALPDVAAGTWWVRVERIGYRPVTVRVRVGSGERSRVSVALEVEPIALDPLEISVGGEIQVAGPDGVPVSLGRVSAERLRQERWLASDARLVGRSDFRESASLGEMDLFRTLQRLPGVSTRDDYSAELWTRGADWGETRVYLDGMPLFNPVHGFGLLSGVSTRVLGSAAFHPGVRPTGLPEGSAAVLDLRSLSGRGGGEAHGGVDVSLASAQAWGAGAFGSRGGWSVAGRRSWVDAVASALAPEDEGLPYAFWDVQARGDAGVGDDHRVEVTALAEHDRIRGEIPDVLQGTTASWGNILSSATLIGPLGAELEFRQSVGATRYLARVREVESAFDSIYSAPSEPEADHRMDYLSVRGQVAPAGAADKWSAGYDLTRQSARYEGPQSWPYSRRPPDLARIREDAALWRGAAWGRRRWTPAQGWAVDTELRMAAGSATRTGNLEILPALSARWSPSAAWSVSGGAARYAQYAQSPAPIGPVVQTALHTGRRWILASRDRSMIASEVATLGAEAWLGAGWLASVTGYLRRSEGVLLPDPTPGLLVQRPPLVEGTTKARGVDLSLRRLTGRFTGALAYSLARARAAVLEQTVPAPADRRHTLDATLLARVSGAVEVALAYTGASGAPFTRVLDCPDGACERVVLDAPLRRRSPGYRSLDVVVDVEHRFEGWSLGWFVQGRNVLGHDNAITYEGTDVRCGGTLFPLPDGTCPDGAALSYLDHFVQGIPTLPLIGVRITF